MLYLAQHFLSMQKILLLIFILVGSQLSAQQTIDLHTLGGGGQDNQRSAYMDEEGNIYVLAGSNGSNLTINGVSYSTGMGTNSYSYLVKLDQNRNYVWHVIMDYTISLVYSEQRIVVDTAGNVYITDYHFGSGSVGGQSVPVFTNNIGYFTAKFNAAGVQQWVLPSGGERIEMADDNTIAIYSYRNQSDFIDAEEITNESGTAYFIDTDGNYVNHFQIDESSYAFEEILGRENSGLYYGMRKSVTLGITSNFEMFKCDSNGIITETKLINVIDSYDTPSSVAYDKTTDAYYIAGKFRQRNPFDSPTGTYLSTSMLLHLDNHFNVMSSLQLGPELSVSGAMPLIALQAHEGSLYLAGTFAVSSYTVWTSFGQNHYLFPEDDKMIYAKFTSGLQLQWYREIPELYYTNSILPVAGVTGLSFVGRTSDMTFDGFTHNASGGNDIFIIDTEDNNATIAYQTGMIFIDTDLNGVLDLDNPPAQYYSVTNDAIPGLTQYSGSDGIFSIGIIEGDQTIARGYIPTYWTATTPESYVVTGDLIDDNTDTIYFGITPIPDVQDLTLTINPNSSCRMNTPIYHVVEVCNIGTTVENGEALLFLDSLQNLVDVMPAYSVSGDTILLPYSNLAPGDCIQFYIETFIEIDIELLGENIHLWAIAEPISQDTTPLDNLEHLYQEIIGSYDPNDITVLPSCDIAPSFITDQKELDYLIRFQNTGNDTAFNITITYPISPYLNPSTISYTSSSHDAQFYVEDDLLRIEFQNIQLPDSFVNEQASHGYFRFSVKPQASMVVGNSITATASIFFDFNPPVITNTTTTTLQSGGDLVHFQTFEATCSGQPDGGLLIDAPCFGNNFEVEVDGTMFATTTDGLLNGLSYGTHQIMIHSDGSIIYDGEINIPIENTPITLFATPATCSEYHSGSIELNGGCLPSTYQVSVDGGAFASYPNGLIDHLSSGTYEIRIAGDGDTTTHMVEVGFINSSNGVLFEPIAASCPIASDGQVHITSNCFSTPIYYSINGGELQLLEGGIIQGLSSGNYQIVVTDGTDEVEQNIQLTNSQNEFIGNVNIQHATCPTSADGSISFEQFCIGIDVSYILDSGELMPLEFNSIGNLPVGPHEIQFVVDGQTIATESFDITNTGEVSAQLSNVQATCITQNDGIVAFEIACSTPPYWISTDGASFVETNESVVYGLSPGVHDFVLVAGFDTLYVDDIVITTPYPSTFTEYSVVASTCPTLPGQFTFSNMCFDTEEEMLVNVDGVIYNVVQNEIIELLPGNQHIVITAGDFVIFNDNILMTSEVGPSTEITVTANTLQVTNPAQGNTYQWYVCENDIAVTGAESEIFEPEVSGNYYVSITSDAGCTVTSSCWNLTIIGTESRSIGTMQIFPNPSQGKFSIQAPEGSAKWQLTVFDSQGKLIDQKMINTGITDYEIEVAGLYHLSLSNGHQLLKTKLLVE
jgi:hypothetical protein